MLPREPKFTASNHRALHIKSKKMKEEEKEEEAEEEKGGGEEKEKEKKGCKAGNEQQCLHEAGPSKVS